MVSIISGYSSWAKPVSGPADTSRAITTGLCDSSRVSTLNKRAMLHWSYVIHANCYLYPCFSFHASHTTRFLSMRLNLLFIIHASLYTFPISRFSELDSQSTLQISHFSDHVSQSFSLQVFHFKHVFQPTFLTSRFSIHVSYFISHQDSKCTSHSQVSQYTLHHLRISIGASQPMLLTTHSSCTPPVFQPFFSLLFLMAIRKP